MKSVILTALILGMAVNSGCVRYVYVHPRYPIIPKPDRPKLSPSDLTNNTQLLMSYAKKLEIGVDGYNKYAREKNSESKLYK